MQAHRVETVFRKVQGWLLGWRWRRRAENPSACWLLLVVFLLSIPIAQAQITAALYVTAPANSARVDGSFVTVQFRLTAGISANGIPEFRVQLDREDPALISDTEYVIYGLSPGWHTVTVTLVDANGTPIFGARNQVQFEVTGEGRTSGLTSAYGHLRAAVQ